MLVLYFIFHCLKPVLPYIKINDVIILTPLDIIALISKNVHSLMHLRIASLEMSGGGGPEGLTIIGPH